MTLNTRLSRLTFLDTENIRLLPLLAGTTILSFKVNVSSMIAEGLSRHHAPIFTVDQLWRFVEVVTASVHAHAITTQCPGV